MCILLLFIMYLYTFYEYLMPIQFKVVLLGNNKSVPNILYKWIKNHLFCCAMYKINFIFLHIDKYEDKYYNCIINYNIPTKIVLLTKTVQLSRY